MVDSRYLELARDREFFSRHGGVRDIEQELPYNDTWILSTDVVNENRDMESGLYMESPPGRGGV